MLLFVVSLLFNAISYPPYEPNNILVSQAASDKEVENVINLIDSLPQKCTLKDESKVKEARNAYEALSTMQKVDVTNLMILVEREGQIASLYQMVSEVVSLINALSTSNIDIDIKEDVQVAYLKYQNLDEDQKKLVTNYDVLKSLINKIEEIENKINEVIKLINDLPAVKDIDISIYSKLEVVREKIKGLSEVQKTYLTNLNKVKEIEAKLEEIEIIKGRIEEVEKNLSTLEFEALEEVELEYEKLSYSQRELVVNYSKFYKIYVEVKEALEFNDDIILIISYINYENRELVNILVNRYQEFDERVKHFITNISLINDLIREFNSKDQDYDDALRVVNLIDNLPLKVSLEDKEEVLNVRKEYDALKLEFQKYVTNYHLLLAKENEILRLENEEVKNDLDNYLQMITSLNEETKANNESSEQLFNNINKYLKESQEKAMKGFNKYIVIAISLTALLMLFTILFILTKNHTDITFKE